MHEKSGLLAELESEDAGGVDMITLDHDLGALAQDWPTDRDERVMLAGNSVHFDLGFLRRHLPQIARKLSYRVFDVSAVSAYCRSLGMPRLPKNEAHRAEVDVDSSIGQALACERWLRGSDFSEVRVPHNS